MANCGGPPGGEGTCRCDPMGDCPWRDTSGATNLQTKRNLMDNVTLTQLDDRLMRLEEATSNILRRLTDLATTVGQVNTSVKDVPFMLKSISTGTDYVKTVVAKLRVEANPPEQWILRCCPTDLEEDEDDDEDYKFYAGLVGDTNKAIWTTDWQDAEVFDSKEHAATVAQTLAKDNKGMPKTPASCGWRVWTQPVITGPGRSAVSHRLRDWTQVYPVSYPPARTI